MGSFTQLTYHIVFATKYRRNTISTDFSERLYEYIGGVLRAKKGELIEIGGVEDHIHILARLSPSLAVSDVIREVKACTSKWINELNEVQQTFQWQKGYGAFTVSYSNVEAVRQYIRKQPEHHRKKSFKEEYIEFLTKHGLEYREAHLFEAEHHD